MITINTRDYSINQLKRFLTALCDVLSITFKSKECSAESVCTSKCKAYAFCNDIHNTVAYINKKDK